jgi:hypothetical protein
MKHTIDSVVMEAGSKRNKSFIPKKPLKTGAYTYYKSVTDFSPQLMVEMV